MIRCGHCPDPEGHATVEGVRRCSRGETFRCSWLVEFWYPEDPHPGTRECGATAWEIDGGDGFECEAGHSHVGVERRMREGWDYAADRGEAEGLAKAGVTPYDMQGRIFM